MMQNKSTGQLEPFSGASRIESNFKVTELDFMDSPRCNAPIAFVGERLIFAMGGFTIGNQPNLSCEAYDTVKNQWFKL
jgi:hypothetical protein